MNSCQIVDKETNRILWPAAKIAYGFWEKGRGLLGRKSMGENEALVFFTAGPFHTFFMKFPIDIVFFDRNYRVLKISPEINPFRLSGCFKAYGAIETAAGSAEKKGIKPGAIVDFRGL